jgi:hypothetical protein
MSDEQERGIYRKFNVTRTDGSSEPGGKHAECSYFVLDLRHDPFAIPALQAYADACAETYPGLADDLQSMIEVERVRGHRFGPDDASDMADRLMAADAKVSP